MNKKNKISLKHGYTLIIDENDLVTLKVYTEEYDDIEFDGIKGNLFVASEPLPDEEDLYPMTLEDMIETSKDFFIDWGVDEETANAIINDLGEWFCEYSITRKEAVLNEIDALEKRVQGRRRIIARRVKRIDTYRAEIRSYEDLIKTEVDEILSINKAIESMEETVSRLKATLADMQ